MQNIDEEFKCAKDAQCGNYSITLVLYHFSFNSFSLGFDDIEEKEVISSCTYFIIFALRILKRLRLYNMIRAFM